MCIAMHLIWQLPRYSIGSDIWLINDNHKGHDFQKSANQQKRQIIPVSSEEIQM